MTSADILVLGLCAVFWAGLLTGRLRITSLHAWKGWSGTYPTKGGCS